MTAPLWNDPNLERIVLLFGARTGIAFPPSRAADAELGVRRALAKAGLTDMGQYRRLITTDPSAFDDLVIQLTVGETYFFRHPAQWEVIRRKILPEIREAKALGETLRAWSAGCASGEEPYSLAMLLDQEGWAGRWHVLGTDISRSALEKCRRATYSKWSLRSGESGSASRYLVPRGEEYVVPQSLRDRVVFENLNLALDIYPSRATGVVDLDLILCRNVLIYFDAETIRAVARRMFEALAPGGWLVTGATDPLLGRDAPFEVLLTDAGLIYRRPIEKASDTKKPSQPVLSTKTKLTDDGVLASRDAARSELISSDWRPAKGAGFQHTPKGNLFDDTLPPRPTRFEDTSRPTTTTTSTRTSADGSADQWLEKVRGLASNDPDAAERACVQAVAECGLSAELHYFHAILLLELERNGDALQELRKCLYLDRSLAIAHFTLGSIWQRQGNLGGARRAYRNARDLCRARPAEEIVPLSDQETAGRLADAADAQLERLELATPNTTDATQASSALRSTHS